MASHIMNVFYILTTVITFFRRLRPRHFLQTSFPPLPRNSVRENSLQSLQVCPTLVLLLDGVSVALVEVDCGVDLCEEKAKVLLRVGFVGCCKRLPCDLLHGELHHNRIRIASPPQNHNSKFLAGRI